jgi:uncharacterized protein (DUF305 family)
MHSGNQDGGHQMGNRATYVRLTIMMLLSFAWMYFAMFSMVHVFADVVMNINFVYMAAVMAAPMAVIELAVMRRMYPDQRLNILAGTIAITVLAASFLAIRVQAGVGDEQFLRSMIPHHSGAILMCQQSSFEDAEIKELCSGIIDGQQREIDQMREIRRRLDQ